MKILNKKKNNKGFTLVELLVVIAIIGVLAVLAVPSLFRNIEKTKVAELEADISAIKSSVLTNYSDGSKPVLNKGMYWFKQDDGDISFLPGDAGDGYDPTSNNIEGISMPFGGIYQVDEHQNEPGKVMLTIASISISNAALEKLKLDLGSMVDEKSNTEIIYIILIDKNI